MPPPYTVATFKGESMLIRLALLAILFAMSWGACAQQLWQESVYGMSLDEVRRAFPHAVAGDGAPLSAGADAARRLLVIEDVRIANHNFRAAFFFQDTGLVQVTVQLSDELAGYQVKGLTETLRTALRSKYGEETSSEVGTTPGDHLTAIWMVGQTNISLNYFHFEGVDPFLNVVYQMRISEAAQNL